MLPVSSYSQAKFFIPDHVSEIKMPSKSVCLSLLGGGCVTLLCCELARRRAPVSRISSSVCRHREVGKLRLLSCSPAVSLSLQVCTAGLYCRSGLHCRPRHVCRGLGRSLQPGEERRPAAAPAGCGLRVGDERQDKVPRGSAAAGHHLRPLCPRKVRASH